MSNGIASGVPPADGCDGEAAGVGVCAWVAELAKARAQAANVIETIKRITFSWLKRFGLHWQPSDRMLIAFSNPTPMGKFQRGRGMFVSFTRF
jgi:hypothetical protein